MSDTTALKRVSVVVFGRQLFISQYHIWLSADTHGLLGARSRLPRRQRHRHFVRLRVRFTRNSLHYRTTIAVHCAV
jgi:hypothetical protein